MSTRSLNIIKKDETLHIFWMHWDGGTAADVILDWTKDQLNHALKIVSQDDVYVASIHTGAEITERMKSKYDEYLATLFDVKHRTDKELNRKASILIDAIKEDRLDFVSTYPWNPKNESCIMTYVTPVKDFGDISKMDSRKILRRIYELCYDHFENDFEVINYVDFDARICRFDATYYIWNTKTNSYGEPHHRTLKKAYKFEDVIQKGERLVIGNVPPPDDN